jgi:uncharacterized protein YjiS (DUF1127 family)
MPRPEPRTLDQMEKIMSMSLENTIAASTWSRSRNFWKMLTAAMYRIEEWRRHRADAAMLSTMTDYELKDIGLNRSDIGAIAGGFYDLGNR